TISKPLYDYVSNDGVYQWFLSYRLPKPVAGYIKPVQAAAAVAAPNRTYPTIKDYFDALNRKYGSGTVKYRYCWWERPGAMLAIYPAAGLVLIGGVWPTVLGLLIGAGLGPKRKKDDDY